MSLRARLIVGVLVLVALALGAFSGLTYLALRVFLVGRVDAQLATTPPRLVTEICLGTHGDSPTPPIPLLVAQLDAAGRPGATCPRAGYIRPLHLSDGDAQRLAHRPRVPMEVDGPDGPVRAIAFEPVTGGWPDRDGDGPAGGSGQVTHGAPWDPGHPGAPGDPARPGAPGDPARSGAPGDPARSEARSGTAHPGRSGVTGQDTVAPGAGGLEVAALSLDDVHATLDRLVVLELAIGALALVFAGSAGAFGVARGYGRLPG